MVDRDGHGPVPTGTVSFTDNGVAVAGCGSVARAATEPIACTVTYARSNSGTHHIGAAFSGDTAYEASGATLTETVASRRCESFRRCW